jgi:hypothetical protein
MVFIEVFLEITCQKSQNLHFRSCGLREAQLLAFLLDLPPVLGAGKAVLGATRGWLDLVCAD